MLISCISNIVLWFVLHVRGQFWPFALILNKDVVCHSARLSSVCLSVGCELHGETPYNYIAINHILISCCATFGCCQMCWLILYMARGVRRSRPTRFNNSRVDGFGQLMYAFLPVKPRLVQRNRRQFVVNVSYVKSAQTVNRMATDQSKFKFNKWVNFAKLW